MQVASFYFLRFFAAQYQQLQLVIVCSTETSLFFGLDFKKAVIFLAFFTVEFGTSFPIWFDPKKRLPYYHRKLPRIRGCALVYFV